MSMLKKQVIQIIFIVQPVTVLMRKQAMEKGEVGVMQKPEYGPMLSIVGKEHSLPNTVRHSIERNEK